MLLRRPHDLADLFRDGRARSGWSQSALAERLGVSRQWVSLVETGRTSVEFDLVVGALQALGYRLSVESSEEAPSRQASRTHSLPIPVQNASGRALLTRRGEPLGKQRTRRHRHGPDLEADSGE